MSTFVDYLNQLRVELLPDQTLEPLLGQLCSYCLQQGNFKAFMKVLLDRWDVYRTKRRSKQISIHNEDLSVRKAGLSLMAEIFFNKHIPDAALAVASRVRPNHTFYLIVNEYIEHLRHPTHLTPSFGLSRLDTIFSYIRGKESKSNLYKLLDKAHDLENSPVSFYLIYMIRRDYPEYAPKPSWIVNKHPPKDNLDYVPYIPTPNEIMSALDTYLNNTKLDLLNRGEIVTKINSKNPNQLVDAKLVLQRGGIYQPPMRQVDIQRLQRYGPSNPLTGSLLQDYRRGLDTMVKSTYYNGQNDQNKFKGACWYCPKLLKAPELAWRTPMPEGGWLGWFCGLECSLNYMDRLYRYTEDYTKIKEIYYISRRFISQLNQYGLYYEFK